jgi:hypothetical protein
MKYTTMTAMAMIASIFLSDMVVPVKDGGGSVLSAG